MSAAWAFEEAALHVLVSIGAVRMAGHMLAASGAPVVFFGFNFAFADPAGLELALRTLEASLFLGSHFCCSVLASIIDAPCSHESQSLAFHPPLATPDKKAA